MRPTSQVLRSKRHSSSARPCTESSNGIRLAISQAYLPWSPGTAPATSCRPSRRTSIGALPHNEAERVAELARLNQVVASRQAPKREFLHARRIRCEDLHQVPSASLDQCVRELQKRLRAVKSPE